MKHITIKKFAHESGYTPKAVYNKIQRSIWRRGIHYDKAPDGRIFIYPEAIEKWIRGV